MDLLFRWGTDVYGQHIVLGANWSLIWWFIAAGAAFIVSHALAVPILQRRRERVMRSRRR